MTEPQVNVLSIRFPLSADPLFIQIEDMDESLDSVLAKTVAALEESEDKSMATQLARLLTDHNPYTTKGAQLDRSSNMGTLLYEPHVIEEQTVHLAEITLLREHRGGQ